MMTPGFSVSSGSVVATITIKATSDAPAGTIGTINITNIGVTNGEQTIPAGTATKQFTVVVPTPDPVVNPTPTPNNNVQKKTPVVVKSSNANLTSMTSEFIKFDFNADVLEYSFSVPYDVNKLNLQCTPSDSKATVNIEGDDLKVGSNLVKITITAENGSQKAYKLNVTKEDKKDVIATADNTIDTPTTDITVNKDDNNIALIIISVITLIIVLAGSCYIVVKKKKD